MCLVADLKYRVFYSFRIAPYIQPISSYLYPIVSISPAHLCQSAHKDERHIHHNETADALALAPTSSLFSRSPPMTFRA